MRLPSSLTSLTLLALSAATQVRKGSIRGTVLADDGRPVAGAHISAEVMQGSKIRTVLDAKTDDLGIFLFSRLAAGKYRMSAEKREDGYLSTRRDITCEPAPATIVRTPDTLTATTVIRFGPKAGIITGLVRDSATGRSIPAHLSLAPMSGCGWSTTGDCWDFQVPAANPGRYRG